MHTESRQDERKALVAKVEAALAPAFIEVLSEETRKAQRALLVTSFLLLLVTLNAITFSGKVEAFGLAFAGPVAKNVIVVLGLVICIYLEALVGMRCYTEWHLWLLRKRAGDLDAEFIKRDIEAARDKLWEKTGSAVAGNKDEPIGDGYVQIEIPPSAIKLSVPWSIMRPRSLYQRIRTFLFGFQTAGMKQIIPRAVYEATAQFKEISPQYAWFLWDYQASARARLARVIIEIVFPLAFGASAIIIASVWLSRLVLLSYLR